MIKWVVCDLDGTLYKHDQNKLIANPNTINLINNIKKNKNVIFTFSTGRHYLNAINMLTQSGLQFDNDDYVVGLNGSQIYSFKNKKLIFEKLIKNELLLVLNEFIKELNKLYENKYLIIFYGNHNDIIFLRTPNTNFDSMVEETLKFHGDDTKDFQIKFIDNVNDVGDVFKCTIYIKDKNFKYEHLKNYLNKISKNDFEITKSTTFLLELMPKEINKSVALSYINNNYYNFNKNDILAFGDSLNDLEMFKFAKTSITRSNADEQLMKIATYVIDAEPSDFVLDGLELLIGD